MITTNCSPSRALSQRQRALCLLSVGLLLLAFGAVCLSGTGCAGTAGVVRALAKDTNSVAVKVTTPWGSMDYERNR